MSINKKKILLHSIFAVGAIAVSVVFSLRSISFSEFLTRAIIYSILIYLIMFALYSAVRSFVKKNIIECCFSLAAASAVLFFMVFVSMQFLNVGCEPGKTLPHLRMNTITKKCEFGGYSRLCSVSDPWYYTTGCQDLSNQQKYEFMNNTNSFDTWVKICSNYCMEGNRERFCKQEKGQLPCWYLVNCNGLEC